jgi:hypothetical protein
VIATDHGKTGEWTMSHRTKIVAVAAILAASAPNAFASKAHHHSHAQRIESDPQFDPQLIEGRSSAPRWDFYTGGMPSSRDFMVNELGN